MPFCRMVGMCLGLVLIASAANGQTPRRVDPHHPLHTRLAKALRPPLPEKKPKRRVLLRRRLRHPLRRVAHRTERRVGPPVRILHATANRAPRPAIGKAAWYDLRGRITASGERFDPKAATAAHRSLPLLSYARVTNLGNGRSIVVKINDRGPVSRGLIIDLSEGAAARLRMIGRGIARVLVEPLPARLAANPRKTPGPQLAAFPSSAAARR